jgi:hypothetical protein
MAIPKTPIIVIIIVFALIVGIALLMSTIQIKPGHTVSNESQELLEKKLASGDRAYLAFPPKTIYTAGDAFSASLGIINLWDSERDFYIEIVQESGPDGGPAVSYLREAGSLAPGESRTLDIGVASSGQTPSGIYNYVVLVCNSQPCSSESPELYSLTHMSFRIR